MRDERGGRERGEDDGRRVCGGSLDVHGLGAPGARRGLGWRAGVIELGGEGGGGEEERRREEREMNMRWNETLEGISSNTSLLASVRLRRARSSLCDPLHRV